MTLRLLYLILPVAALLGRDWRHGDHALQIHLALKLHAVMSDP